MPIRSKVVRIEYGGGFSMRTKNEALMQEIVEEVDEFYSLRGRTPTTRELAEMLGISHTTVIRYLQDMDARKMLDYDNGKIVTEKISKSQDGTVSVPLVGSISCGQPLLSEESVESYIRIPTEWLGSGEYFLLRANGNSMVDAGIDDEDIVIIRKTSEAEDGDIVVALVDNENTLKRLYRDEKKRKIILHPENPDYDDIVVDYCEIQGVAVKVLKDL